MAFIGVAIGGSVLNAGLGYLGATNAANTQAQSAANALAFQKQAFQTSQDQINSAKTNFQPYLQAGNQATYTLGQLMGGGGSFGGGGASGSWGGSGNTAPDYSSFFNSPDYNFAQSQGQKGVINAANAQGIGLSGGTLKDLSQFNSGLATQQYGNYFNRLMGLSNMGANAASGLGNLATGQANNATNAATGIGNTTMGMGQAQASGIVGGTNAITGAVNGGISNSLMANYIAKMNPSGYSSAANAGTSNAVSNGGFNYLDAAVT
jgi:hypothetical protein